MKKATILTVLLTLAIIVHGQEKDNTLTPEEFAFGWELLFDGESLKGWKAYNGDEPQGWAVKDGSLYCTGVDGGDDLMSIAHFRDFDLRFHWKIEKGGNSGVLYRVREGKQFKSPYHTGPEYQVMDDPGEFDNKSTGSLYDVVAPSPHKELNPAMEWNSGRIRVSNNMVTHWLNGVMVLQCEMHSDEWEKAVSESKWRERPFYGMAPFGHIDFQNHGAEVWYKNVKIKVLN